jgi:hypothetical protein
VSEPGASADGGQELPSVDPAQENLERWGPYAGSGSKFVRWNLATLFLGLAVFAAGALVFRAQGTQAAGAAAVLHDPLGLAGSAVWDDGQGELATYSVRDADGATHEVTLAVSVAPGQEGALRLVCVEGRTTEQVLLSRADPRLVLGISRTRQSWGGHDYTQEGQQAGWRPEQLPFTLRALDWEAAPRLEVPLLADDGTTRSATIHLAGEEGPVEVPQGAHDCLHLVLTHDGGQSDHYWIARAGLRPVVRFEVGGRVGELVSLERRPLEPGGP